MLQAISEFSNKYIVIEMAIYLIVLPAITFYILGRMEKREAELEKNAPPPPPAVRRDTAMTTEADYYEPRPQPLSFAVMFFVVGGLSCAAISVLFFAFWFVVRGL